LREVVSDEASVSAALPGWNRVFTAMPAIAHDLRSLVVDP
jgi:hypothetical protein